ncbi:MAG: hypothetical protein SXG53_21440, partial [Pseudomonadota bacterium]|nr:hypothetical protein [Pseudomonadota bacterium]
MQRPVKPPLRLLLLLAITAAGTMPSVVAAKPIAREADAPEQPHWSITNQANARYQDGPGAPETELSSNVLRTYVPLNAPIIQWYNDAHFTREATVAEHGQQVYLAVDSEACNLDPGATERVKVTITSSVSHDEEMFWAYEADQSSWHYHVAEPIPLVHAASNQAIAHDGILQLSQEDMLTATVDDCGTGTALDTLLVDPKGVVFDSTTNNPVAGATVRLIDVTGDGNGGRPGEDAVVYQFDGVTPAPSSAVTDAEGIYQFPLVAPSQYRLIVTPPGDYRFPSTATLDRMSPWGRVLADGSYGQQFEVSAASGSVELDIPVDTSSAGLFLQKRAARESAEIGDTLQYSITMRNVSGLELTQLTLSDRLPPGFTYLKNTARLDGVAVADPAGGKGPALAFPIDGLSAAERTLTYRVAIGPGALEGDSTNRAQLISVAPARKISNLASVKVNVDGGVFDERAFVLGKIFADCNANSIQDAGEPGVPRVRLYMEDGSFVVSDEKGKYSFYGVSPRTHVLKVDAATLPAGTTLQPISHRHAKDGKSQFVDVKRSEMHRADFAIAPCSDALMQSLSPTADGSGAVASLDAGLGRELNLGLQNELKPQGEPDIGDVRALSASGIVGETNTARLTPASSTPTPAGTVVPVAPTSGAAPRTTLETLLRGLDNSTDFIGLIDGDHVGTTQIAVRVKGLAGSSFDLKVNDTLIPSARVGARTVERTRKLEAWEFIGVGLNPGRNSLQLVQRDSFGNARAIREITLIAPDQMAR